MLTVGLLELGGQHLHTEVGWSSLAHSLDFLPALRAALGVIGAGGTYKAVEGTHIMAGLWQYSRAQR